MPLINVKLIEGVFDASQKQQIVRDLTDAMVAIEGENMRPVTWCVVEEVRGGDWGIAGDPLTTEDVKALASGAPVGARHGIGGSASRHHRELDAGPPPCGSATRTPRTWVSSKRYATPDSTRLRSSRFWCAPLFAWPSPPSTTRWARDPTTH